MEAYEDPNRKILGYPELLVQYSIIKSGRETMKQHAHHTYGQRMNVCLHRCKYFFTRCRSHWHDVGNRAVRRGVKAHEEMMSRMNVLEEEFSKKIASFDPGYKFISLVDKEDVELLSDIQTERPQLEMFVAAAAEISEARFCIVQLAFQHNFGVHLERNKLYALSHRGDHHQPAARLASPAVELRCGFHTFIISSWNDPNETVPLYVELKKKNVLTRYQNEIARGCGVAAFTLPFEESSDAKFGMLFQHIQWVRSFLIAEKQEFAKQLQGFDVAPGVGFWTNDNRISK